MKNLKDLRDHFAAKLLAHKTAYELYRGNPTQRKRHLCMYGYNLHIVMTLHTVMQRIEYGKIEKIRNSKYLTA